MINRAVCDVVHAREQMEFPLTANVDHQNVARPSGDHWNLAQNIQGGSLRTCTKLQEKPRCMANQ